MFYAGGVCLAALFIINGIRQYNTAIAASHAPTSKDIVMEAVGKANGHTDSAVGKANAHTDEEVGMVRDDLKKATEHSDQRIGTVRDDLKKTGGDLVARVNRRV
jgi:hypothetical protein